MSAAAYAVDSFARGSSPPGSSNGVLGMHSSNRVGGGRGGGGGGFLAVTADTDPYKVAGVIAYALSASSHNHHLPNAGGDGGGSGQHSNSTPHCVLRIQADPTAGSDVQIQQSTSAARVALMAVQLAHRTLASR